MSVAFTKEEDSESAAAELPDRPISPHPNLVTPQGLEQIEAALAEARAAYSAAQAAGEVKSDRTAMARATRDLRYYAARRASARVVPPRPGDDRVTFGGQATISRPDGRVQTFRIVGEDEADPAKGSISYISPLAKALLGRDVGDVVVVGGTEIEVIDCTSA
jgi:transcription elongation GreA/GreB family factor